ncbi:MAG: hypothetical protein M1823_004353 [Watsoniomyces obsoletus]|nr:MAG: hypothetical protein M1823_004353 [Watsoniomyces obsoletus]
MPDQPTLTKTQKRRAQRKRAQEQEQAESRLTQIASVRGWNADMVNCFRGDPALLELAIEDPSGAERWYDNGKGSGGFIPPSAAQWKDFEERKAAGLISSDEDPGPESEEEYKDDHVDEDDDEDEDGDEGEDDELEQSDYFQLGMMAAMRGWNKEMMDIIGDDDFLLQLALNDPRGAEEIVEGMKKKPAPP